jgi:putative hydrolase of the HAD superfamily
MKRDGVAPRGFVMAGNSLRSDVLPVLEAGGHVVYVAYEGTRIHEHVGAERLSDSPYHQIAYISELPALAKPEGRRSGSDPHHTVEVTE